MPLRVTYTEPAEAEVAEAYEWLQGIGLDAAERWLGGLTKAVQEEADRQSAVSLRRPVAADSPEGRPLSLLLYRTSGRRSSAWHVGYELVDEDADGQPDTLRVVRVRHAAAWGGS